jgi:hypothetical protein
MSMFSSVRVSRGRWPWLRDFDRPDALDGYILTPTGREVLGRLADALRRESSARSWSLTGQYGSGKLALALLVAQLLGGPDRIVKPAREFLRREDAALWQRFLGSGSVLAKRGSRLCPVLVSGAREPRDKAIAGRLALALRCLVTRGRPPKIVEQLEEIASQRSLSPWASTWSGSLRRASPFLTAQATGPMASCW